MADTTNEMSQALKEFMDKRTRITVIPATVKSVNEAELTIDVEDPEGHEIFDVRLRAALDGIADGWILIPEVRSPVLIALIGNSPSEYFVVATTAVTKILGKIDNSTWTIDATALKMQRSTTKMEVAADGILIERNAQSLKTQLQLLIDQV